MLEASLPDAAFDAALDAPGDAPLVVRPPDAEVPPCRRPAPVDLLLVVDDSGSMAEEQLHLAEQLPLLVSELASPPDSDGDGRRDWRAITDIHLAVVTTEVATDGEFSVCGGPEPARDGVFVDTATAAGCASSYPRFLQFEAGEDAVSEISQDFSCIARVGTSGCGIELPLEAMLKALVGDDDEYSFLGGRARGASENTGFLREDSMLAVVFLSDEDDCSFTEAGFLFEEPGSPLELPACTKPDDPLHPVSRYVDALRSLRPERPDLLGVAVIGGVPERLVSDPANIDYDAILNDSFMRNRVDRTSRFPTLVPACEGRWGRAVPARRLVELAQSFGDQATVGSICQASYTPIVGAIARLVGTRACEEFED